MLHHQFPLSLARYLLTSFHSPALIILLNIHVAECETPLNARKFLRVEKFIFLNGMDIGEADEISYSKVEEYNCFPFVKSSLKQCSQFSVMDQNEKNP